MFRCLLIYLICFMQYWGVAQLPFFIPDNNIDVEIIQYQSNSKSGYYFLAPWQVYPAIATSGHAVILDRDLNVIFYRPFKRPPSGIFTGVLLDFKFHPNGLMSYYFNDGTTSAFYIMDSTFSVIDTVTCISRSVDPHDLKILNDGSYYILCNDFRVVDLSSDTGFGNRIMSNQTNVNATGGVIQHISHSRQLLFEWNAFDHCNYNDVQPHYINSNNSIDWTHGNSVDILADGNLLLSLRNFDQVLKISRIDTSVIWRLGGKRSDFIFSSDSGFNNQHTASMNGTKIALFDNGRYHQPPLARGVEYELDTVHRVAILSYSYSNVPGFESASQGSYQLLPNKDRIISWGNGAGQPPWSVTELDSNQQKTFEIDFGGNYQTYRAFYFDIPWTIKRPEIGCFVQTGQIYLYAPPHYSRFVWSNGDSARIIKASPNNMYQLFVNYGSGMVGSLVYDVSVSTCMDSLFSGTNGINAEKKYPFVSYAATAKLLEFKFSSEYVNKTCDVQLIDLSGRKVMEFNFQIAGIESSRKLNYSLASGIYVLKLFINGQPEIWNHKFFIN